MQDDGRKSFGAYAKHRGCSKQAVSRAWKSRRIHASVLVVDGRPTVPDFARADVEWAENTDLTRNPALIGQGEEGEEGASAETGYFGASAREKHWKAELAELNYKQRSGELVNAAEAASTWADFCSTVRMKLLGLPNRMKQAHHDLTLGHLASMDQYIREALEELARGTQPDEAHEGHDERSDA